MLEVYIKLVKYKFKTLEQVPEEFREQIKERLNLQ